MIGIVMCAVAALAAEPGVEYGVSGAFGGMMGNVPVIVGGCNFPFLDPIAAQPSDKTFYCGIYNAETGERLGSLPVKTAYGASIQTADGLVMAGGSTRNVWLLRADGTLADLPRLPHLIDNAYGAAIGRKLYIAGGNHDGKPSTALMMLNLDHRKAGWQKVADMPGLPRVQPVMAAAGGKLYIWGGFNTGEPKTVATDGLCFDPANGSWTPMPEPHPGLTLSGGVATTISDNQIICAGGVNRDIFLDAITHQADDYLLHPIEWYKFNGRVCIFHPVDRTWNVMTTHPEQARAGASIAILPDGSVLMMGGELKPRVRTPQSVRISF